MTHAKQQELMLDILMLLENFTIAVEDGCIDFPRTRNNIQLIRTKVENAGDGAGATVAEDGNEEGS